MSPPLRDSVRLPPVLHSVCLWLFSHSILIVLRSAEAHAGELFFNCHPIPVSEAATDEEAARKLWAVSEKLCGL